jgi:DNA-binding MarR family transcriptional regulator
VSKDTPTDTVPWLTGAEVGAWLALMGTLMSLPPAIDAQLKRDSGLNFFEYSILVSLSRPQSHAVQMSHLAMLAGGSLSRLSHAVSRMERQGWVSRRAGAGCTEAVLTPAGLAKLDEAAPGHVREVRRLVFDALTPEQVGQLHAIARQVLGVTAPGTAELVDQTIAAAESESETPRRAC